MTLSSQPDVLIVGGGAIGLLSAWELAVSGLKVTVLERRRAARESSWAGGGILSPLNPWRYPEAVTALAAWGQPRFRIVCETLSQATGIDPEWTAGGMLVLDPEDEASARTWAKRWNCPMESLEPDEFRKRYHQLTPPSRLALWLPGVAQLRTPRFGKALRSHLPALGVECRENTRVTAIRTQAERIRGVETTQGRIDAEHIVLAAGAWSGALAQSLGLKLEVRPVQGQMLLYHGAPGLLSPIVLQGDRYLIPRRDGRILIGSTLDNHGFDKKTTREAREDLHRSALNILPDLERLPIEHQWAGLRPGQSGSIPWIGEHPRLRGLWVNTGHFRNGLVLSLASARLLADLLQKRTPILPAEPYAW